MVTETVDVQEGQDRRTAVSPTPTNLQDSVQGAQALGKAPLGATVSKDVSAQSPTQKHNMKHGPRTRTVFSGAGLTTQKAISDWSNCGAQLALPGSRKQFTAFKSRQFRCKKNYRKQNRFTHKGEVL